MPLHAIALRDHRNIKSGDHTHYESGRNIPRPVQALLRLVHVEQIDINKVKRDDVDVAEYLKASNPELYKTLKKEARAKRKER